MSDGIYLKLGASATKDEVKNAIEKQSKGLFPGAFCKIIDDPAGDPDYCALMHADGAGTKSTLAYIMYKETGNKQAFKGIAQDSTVMNIDDLLCVGATDKFLMSNTIGRNAHRVSGELIKEIIVGYDSFIEEMKKYGVEIIMTGGETADVGDLVNTAIVDSTIYVRMPKSKVIDLDNVKPGNVIVGFASFGKANYEEKENSGVSSNGLTAARHLLLSKYYADKYPETYSSSINKEDVYTGKYKFEDKLPDSNLTVGEAILSPTRTYAPIIKNVLDKYSEDITGIVHCTGGGQVKCKNFGQNLHYIKDNLFETPAIFKAIKENSNIADPEMYQVFNMGHRLEIYCEASVAENIIEISKGFGVDAKIVGRVEENEGGNKVTIIDKGNTYIY